MLGEEFFAWFLLTSISGTIANRVDAKTVSIVTTYRDIVKRVKEGKIVNSDMQKAVQRSYLLALKSICESCLNEKNPISYQQNIGKLQLSSDVSWLEKKQFYIEKKLKAIEKSKYDEPSIEALNEIEVLLIQEGGSTKTRFQTFKGKLIEKAIGKNDSPKCYKKNVEDTLFERMRDNFANEIKNNQAVNNIFEAQILVQTDIKVDMIVDYVHNFAEILPQFLEKMDKIHSEIQSESTLQHFMTLYAYLDSSNERYWPKWKDVKDGMLYWTEDYFEEIEKNLEDKRHCMITGVSGSGKTALAISFGLWWRDSSKRNHPETAVFYVDALKGYSEERGEDWYREVLTHDDQNEIFIIDNCHLSTEAVNAFCFQWRQNPPKNALLLLISAPKILESPYEDEPEDYFIDFEQTEIVSLHPEHIYKDILKAYSDAYCRIDPQLFIPVEEDLNDSCRADKLERLCSHNLIVARRILETWGDVGGRLSDVTEEAALDSLAYRYFIDKKAPNLAQDLALLCNLGQFEITIHNSFIRQLPRESVYALRKRNMISSEDSPFGRCFRISFHPQVAALIFRAYIYKEIGYGFERRINDEIFQSLKEYLSYYPENFILVYSRLYKIGAIELNQRLLCDAELQICASKQFNNRPLNEVIWYLYGLNKIHPEKAKNLLQDFTNKKTVEELQMNVIELNRAQFNYVVKFLIKIDLDISLKILGGLPSNWVFNRIKYSNLNYIAKWIRPTPSSFAAKLGYSNAWCQQIGKMLDLDVLIEQALRAHPQELAWFLDYLIDVDSEKAKHLLDRLSPEILGEKVNNQPFSIIVKYINIFKKLEYDSAFYRTFFNMLDRKTLFINAKDASLQNIYWFLHLLKDVDSELAENLLIFITPVGLAEMFRIKQGTVQDINHFIEVSDRNFLIKFFYQIGKEEIVAIFERSKLGQIGSLLKRYYSPYEETYEIFSTQNLHNKLATERISEINKFIKRIHEIPIHGQRLAVQAIETMLKTDFVNRIIENDVEQFSLLLFNVYKVDHNYPSRILSALAPSGAMEKALQHSSIHGIQLLVRNLSEMAPEYIPEIKQSLQTLDLSDRIKEAEIESLKYFLWNIRAHLGAELAQSYCEIIDANIQSKQIANCNLTELGGFLWNLVHISEKDDFRILSISILKERLEEEWKNNPGQFMSIFGILVTINTKARTKLNLSPHDIDSVSDILKVWLMESLNDGRPYTFSLTVRGLLALDESRTAEIIQNTLYNKSIMEKYLRLFRETMAQAITPRSITVLEEVDRFITLEMSNR